MKRGYNSFNYIQIAGYVIFLSLIIAGNVTAVEFDGGTGEPNIPYLISTPEQLKAIGDSTINDKCFTLVADIDLDPNLPGNEIITDRTFIPYFRGTLDGNGHSISNMVSKSNHRARIGNSSAGLIGLLGLDGLVRDIELKNITILGVGRYVGALIASNRGIVLRCSVTGSISGESFVGGLVGDNTGEILSCSAFCTVQSVQEGIVGLAGGLVGYNYYGCIYNCYARGTITGVEDVGGLVGASYSYISNCYAMCTVTGYENVGGLVGENASDISNCYAIGTVTGEESVGGLIGNSDNSYSTVSQCYAVCEITADSNDSIGGLIGKSSGRTMLSFWDTQVSGQKISAGGVGLHTAKLQDTGIYLNARWDMTGETSHGLVGIWTIAEPNTYPQLTKLTDQYPVTQLSGSGTPDDPYEIATAEELAAINDYEINAHYALIADIDLSGIIWATAPILFFNGTFDGRGHMISNLTVEGGSYLGLFGKIVSDGVVTNLTIKDASVIGYDYIGALAGQSFGRITNCHVTGSVAGESYIGGLVGLVSMLYSSTFEEQVYGCTADVAVSGNDHIHNIANAQFYD